MNALADVSSLPASSPWHSAGIHSPWQRTVLIVHMEVQRGDQGGRAERDTLCHLATVARFFSFCFCKALLTSHSLDPNSILFPQLHVTCRSRQKFRELLTHGHSLTLGFQCLLMGALLRSLSHTHLKVLCLSERFRQGRS